MNQLPNIFRIACLAIAAVLFAAPLGRATTTPTFEYEASAGTFNTPAGQTLSINIYLTETSYPATNVLQTENGLSDSALQLTRTSGNATFSAVTPNGAFGDSSTTGSFSNTGANPSASFILSIPATDTATTGVLSSPNQTLLGVVQLTAGTATSTFTVANSSQIYQSITFGIPSEGFGTGLYDLDEPGGVSADYQAATGSNFTVAVPEPSVASMLAMACGVLQTRQRILKRK